jgi:hypothetical protein
MYINILDYFIHTVFQLPQKMTVDETVKAPEKIKG